MRGARVREAWVGLWGLGCEARVREARVREAWVGLWSLGRAVGYEADALSSVSCRWNEVVCCSCHELR